MFHYPLVYLKNRCVYWFKRNNNTTHDLLFAIGANFMVLAHMTLGFYLSNGMGGTETYAFAPMSWVDNTWYHPDKPTWLHAFLLRKCNKENGRHTLTQGDSQYVRKDVCIRKDACKMCACRCMQDV